MEGTVSYRLAITISRTSSNRVVDVNHRYQDLKALAVTIEVKVLQGLVISVYIAVSVGAIKTPPSMEVYTH